jgi:hypothetical protein
MGIVSCRKEPKEADRDGRRTGRAVGDAGK